MPSEGNPRKALIAITTGVLIASSARAMASAATSAPADSTAQAVAGDTAHVVRVFPTIEVTGAPVRALALPAAASQGSVTPREIALRPLLRTGDVLETVPGLLISQHSGEGKANQYYLRGYNLDHGTDFATTVAGVPMNMPTHAHGQGYTDLNPVIPELISGIEYRKGTYSVEDGDFSSAGSAHIAYRDALPGPIASITAGQEGYLRAFAGVSPRFGPGMLLGAIELERNDGPWVHPDDYRKVNGLVRYSFGTPERSTNITAMGYDGRWNSTDQIPERAVASGAISRFGAIDPTDGGTTSRYSLTAELRDVAPRSINEASAYLIAYRLDLFSNFTYFLTDTLHGDQIEQSDNRFVAGLHLLHSTSEDLRSGQIVQTIGLDVRHDDITNVGLYHTESRQRLATIRDDRVLETSASPYVQSDARWMPGVRTIVGLRADGYLFSDASSYAPFSGNGADGLVSPKASVVLGPWAGVEVNANAGYGFHSDDVRGASYTSGGTTQGVQMATEHIPVPGGPAVLRSSLLVRTRGAETGARFTAGSRGSVAASLWGLDIDSEHVFLGDQGLSAPSRPSRRTGIEVSGDCRPGNVHLDADLAYSRARFRDPDPAGNYIPGAVEGVASAGIEYERPALGFAGLRLRYFGPRPLIEDNSVRSGASTVLNAEVGYDARRPWSVVLQAFNLLDRAVSDVDYYYVSRLPGEPTIGVADVHTHPQGPRSIRLVVSMGSTR
ncbi:MAG: TonB-dependent receptor [Candidatus Eisenbacteria bacterium]